MRIFNMMKALIMMTVAVLLGISLWRSDRRIALIFVALAAAEATVLAYYIIKARRES